MYVLGCVSSEQNTKCSNIYIRNIVILFFFLLVFVEIVNVNVSQFSKVAKEKLVHEAWAHVIVQ